jgi:hypothetical protein
MMDLSGRDAPGEAGKTASAKRDPPLKRAFSKRSLNVTDVSDIVAR